MDRYGPEKQCEFGAVHQTCALCWCILSRHPGIRLNAPVGSRTALEDTMVCDDCAQKVWSEINSIPGLRKLIGLPEPEAAPAGHIYPGGPAYRCAHPGCCGHDEPNVRCC